MIYFDNAATTIKKPRAVWSQTIKFCRKYGANAGRGQHELSQIASITIQQTKDKLKKFLRCAHFHSVAFTPSATIAINVVLKGLDFSKIQNVYISPFEHNSVLRTLYALQEQHLFTIHQLSVTEDGVFDLDKIAEQFAKDKPNLMVVSHVSNVCGTIAPIEQLCQLAKRSFAVCVIDMSQSCGLIDLPLRKVNADFFIFAGHKTLHAFYGVAGIIYRQSARLKCFIHGGTGVDSQSRRMPEELSSQIAGSSNILAIKSLDVALTYLAQKGIANIEAKERQLTKALKKILSRFDFIKIIGDNAQSISVVSATFEGMSPEGVAAFLNRHKICVRAGLHCSPLAHRHFNTLPLGTLRLSIDFFTKRSDLRRLNGALKKLQKTVTNKKKKAS